MKTRLDKRYIQRDRGIALLIVLWFLTLLSLLAVTAAGTARTDTRITHNIRAEAEARYVAEAAIAHATMWLFASQAGIERQQPQALQILNTDVQLDIQDECGKIDINTGWGGLLRGLLNVSGGGDASFAILQALLDWRDPDNRRRVRGAEDDDYAARGLPYGARDGLFEVTEEAGQVLGMTAELYRRMAPYITVDCLAAGIDETAAREAVIMSIPETSKREARAYIKTRDDALRQDIEPPAFKGGGKYIEPSSGQTHMVRVIANVRGGARAEWEAIVWLTGDAQTPFLLRRWQRPLRNPPPVEPRN